MFLPDFVEEELYQSYIESFGVENDVDHQINVSDDHFDLKVCLENAHTPHKINTQYKVVSTYKNHRFRFIFRRT